MEFSSGVRVRYGPFPGSLYWDIMGKALDEHPDPEMPQKTIEVLGGTEEVDNPDDPEYKKALRVARNARFDLVGKAALELCVDVEGWPGEWEAVTDRLINEYGAKVNGKVPETDEDRRLAFLLKYALRTDEDWKIVGRIQRFSQIDDEEVRRQAENFPGDVAGAEGAGPDAPGAAEV